MTIKLKKKTKKEILSFVRAGIVNGFIKNPVEACNAAQCLMIAHVAVNTPLPDPSQNEEQDHEDQTDQHLQAAQQAPDRLEADALQHRKTLIWALGQLARIEHERYLHAKENQSSQASQ